MHEVTQILSRINSGETHAAQSLLPLVYDELRKLAAAQMSREQPEHVLQATALVHEAYLRLVDTEIPQDWNSRGHFFAAAAEAMRRILVDSARERKSLKRGGHFQSQPLLDQIEVPEVSGDLLALDEALTEFASVDPRACELVKLRCFAGLSLDETATALEISHRTADRLWAYARAWLADRLR
jgi:RNA polymerase sigma factor (TIGR02999 family)